MSTATIYQYSIQQFDGEEVSLSAFKNKVLLIVNIASQCGFASQLKDLVALKETYAGQDFEILAFPSNDFGGQEPLDGEELESFCKGAAKNYLTFNKVRVRGPYAHPLFRFLSDKKLNGVFNAVPKWNFHKFLVDKSGKVVDYFYPFTKPTSSKIRKKISRLLAADKK